jgi:hypothetical protein
MSRIVRWRPTPALVISCIALFVALGGVGYAAATIGSAQIKNNSVRGRDIKNGTIRSRDVRKDALGPHAIKESKLTVAAAGVASLSNGSSHFAVVGANGVIARGRGLASNPVRTGAGRYQLIFNRDVRGCAYVATQGVIGATTPGPGQIGTSALASNPNGVFVRTFDSQGAPADRSFHLIVSC